MTSKNYLKFSMKKVIQLHLREFLMQFTDSSQASSKKKKSTTMSTAKSKKRQPIQLSKVTR